MVFCLIFTHWCIVKELFYEDEKLSPYWRVAAVLILVVGFSVLGFVTKLAYDNAPPIPSQVVDTQGKTIMSYDNIIDGQGVFLKYNLMEHGTLWGHGAYLGPDYTASYLHQQAIEMQDLIAMNTYEKKYADLGENEQITVGEKIPLILKKNRYDPQTETLVFTDEQATVFDQQKIYWDDYFNNGKAPGLPTNYIRTDHELNDLVAFFSWASWAAATKRPGEDFTYTNNFPYDPMIGNLPSTDAYFWSAVSLTFMLGGLGLVLFLFGKFNFLGWSFHNKPRHLHETQLKPAALLPSQRAVIPYFVVVVILFLLQSLIGGLVAHYRVEPTFYGLDLAKWLPYNLLRTWHLQLAIFWIATSWVGSGLFIAPLFSGQDAKHQALGIRVLLAAFAVVIFGSLIGEFVSNLDLLPDGMWFWIGNQGSEYLDLGRFWQYLMIGGFLFWLFLLYRALTPAFKIKKVRELSILFFLAASAIPIFYIPAIFYDHQTNFTIIDNWRFWIIHLWVEGFFEVFATVITAIIFVQMGITKPIVAKRLIYLDMILYLGSGVIGTGHHWYFSGQTNINMALSACFSAMEVIPLTILTLDAWDFISVSKTKCEKCGEYLAQRQKSTIYFLISVGVWNFIGAGVFGFLINLPVISYFEIGTNLTANHGHAAMFGVFGMLSLGTVMFCLRSYQTEEIYNKTKGLVRTGLWGVNVGMALMVIIDLFPSGLLQMWDSMKHGYWHAREISFIMSGTFHTLAWLRIIGDLVFLLLGALPIVIAVLMTYYYGRKNTPKSI
jgi:nitric oxide reductase subunit B